jgi:predicted nucleic acid-binding protein
MYLLDTNVVSALGPGRGGDAADVANWIGKRSDQLYLSAVTIAETEAGAARLRRIGAHRRAELIGRWIEGLIALFANRILPFDLHAARAAGLLHDRARARGFEPGFADVAIASTAKTHRLLVLTRNAKHFSAIGIAFHDPFVSPPPEPGSAAFQ